MRKTWVISTYALLLLGVVHVGYTPILYRSLSVKAMWFLSCGLMLVFQALLNILAEKTRLKSGYLLALLANLASLVFILVLAWMLREIQALVGVLIGLMVTAGSLYFWKKA